MCITQICKIYFLSVHVELKEIVLMPSFASRNPEEYLDLPY